MIKLDGVEVKVGDRLWSFVYGWGIVVGIDYNDLNPIRVEFPRAIITYREEGGSSLALPRTLFWDELNFEIPKPPKVEKWKWILQEMENKDHFIISDNYYTEKEAYDRLGLDMVWHIIGRLGCSMKLMDRNEN